MSDLNEFGERVRAELGSPPADWEKRQSLRLRELDLDAQKGKRWPLVAAAAVVFAACIGLFFTTFASRDAPTASTRSSLLDSKQRAEGSENAGAWMGADTKTTRRLGDGSLIELERGARGRLDESVDSGTRFDLHEGSATFHVEKRVDHPFAVVAGEYEVVVVGTLFTVSYAPPHQLDVTVEEGVVDVHVPKRSEPVRVEAGESFSSTEGKFSLQRGKDNRPEDATTSDTPPDTGTVSEHAGSSERAAPSEQAGFSEQTEQTPSAHSWQALYREGKYQEACRTAQERSLSQWHEELGPSGLLDLSTTLRLCGDSAGSLATLRALRGRFAASSEAKDALFLIGRIHATGGNSREAIGSLEQYLESGGDARFAQEALGRLIELHLARAHHDKARHFAERYLRLAPHGPYRQLAESVRAGP